MLSGMRGASHMSSVFTSIRPTHVILCVTAAYLYC